MGMRAETSSAVQQHQGDERGSYGFRWSATRGCGDEGGSQQQHQLHFGGLRLVAAAQGGGRHLIRAAHRGILASRTTASVLLHQECHSAGCCTPAEAKMHIEQKRRKEYEAKESGMLLSNNKSGHKTNWPMKVETDGNLDLKKGSAILDARGRDSPITT